ncbi:hypothetical protein [Thermococcus sp.]|uniref:hypothetical protein n=1 Tax=Thermococcus sp. TaxID=35749 RepID=UPI00262D8AF6|nr:hypothetical protein [Thermococcus sp.]
MAKLRRILVRDERLWRWGVIALIISLGLVAVGIVAKITTITLPGLFLPTALLALANRLRALEVECNGKTFLLVPDYSTSTIILRDSNGNVISKTFFPLFEEEKLETPCGTLEVRAIRHRFGKVELRISKNEEITLP